MTALKLPRSVALAVVSALVTLGVLVSFMESYRALYWWAQGHAVHGVWAVVWPIQIDAFVAVGELALFVALVDAWALKARTLPWIITALGLAVSVAGNIGHVQTHDVFTRLTAAVPPITAYVMLAASLGLLKRIVAYQPAARRKKVTARKPRATQGAETLETQTLASLGSGAAVVPLPGLDVAPWDPDATSSFPKLDAEGHPVARAA